MKKAVYTLPGIDGAFEGFGPASPIAYDYPLFDFSTAVKVLEASESAGYMWTFDSGFDTFFVRHVDDPPGSLPTPYKVGRVRMGLRLYPLYAIGAFHWDWQRVAEMETA